MSYVNILGEAPDATSKRIRVNQSGQLLAATADFPPNGSVLLGTAYATALQADSVPLAVADPQGRPGWYYTNTALGNKMNWYFYDGTSNNLTYSELNQLTCVMTCDGAAPSGVINVPFFVIYTKTGKTVIYQSSSSIEYIRGQKVLFYFSADAFSYPQNPDQLREVACPILESPSRPIPGPNEEILYITVHSDSAFPATTFTGCISQLGFRFNDNTIIYQLDAPVSTGSGSDVNITNSFLDTHSTLYLGGTPVADGTNSLPVNINGTVVIDPLDTIDVNLTNASIAITNTNIDTLSFTVDKGVSYVNTNSMFGVPVINNCLKSVLADGGGTNTAYVSVDGALLVSVAAPALTTLALTLADFTPTDGSVGAVSGAITTGAITTATVFGTSTHSGGGGTPTLTYQYSLDNITYYDTPYIITLPNATPFSDTRSLGVPFCRFKISSHALDTLVLNISLK